MARYRYVLADLLTDTTITELPDLQVEVFDARIIQPGTLRARLAVPNQTVAGRARTIIPGRTVLHVYRGADLWESYLVWTIVPASDEHGQISVEIQGASLESYLYHREIRAALGPYIQVDQIQIARNLLTAMQTRPEGDIGLQLAAGVCGVLRDRSYKAAESASYGQRLAELASVDNGFEYKIRNYVDPGSGQRVREWAWGYPRLGQAQADHVFTQPGSIVSWRYPQDAVESATCWRTRGHTVQTDLSAESEPLTSQVFEAADLLAAGWPLLDRTVDYPTVTHAASLDSYARWWRDTRSGIIAIPTVTVHLDQHASISPARLGDYARLTLVNDWFPRRDRGPTFSWSWRLVGIEVRPEQRGTPDVATLIFAEELT